MFYRIISAQESKQRRKEVSNEIKKLGLVPIFFDAIMGRDYTQDELNTLALPNNDMLPGEIGCALSHVGVLKEFLSSDESVALVMEDDIDIQDSFDSNDFVRLTKWFDSLDIPAISLLYTSAHAYKKIVSLETIDVYKAFTGALAHAYLINREAAKRIIQLQTPIRFEFDIFKYYYLLANVEIYSLNSDYINQKGFGSLLDDEREGRGNFLNRGRKRKATYKACFKNLSLKHKLWAMWIQVKKSVWEAFYKKKGIQYIKSK